MEETTANNSKWTELELLPEWDEQYYDVYTGKKHGKWVMLKTLKPAYKDDPRFRAMIEKEFDVRYNLAHPGIVMINDYEEVPGLGMCIITDDVYGESLRKKLTADTVNEQHLEKLLTQLIDAMDYIQVNHIIHFPIRPETIIFTDKIENLKLIDVGFDQSRHLTPAEATEDIYSFGKVLKEVLDALPSPPAHLRRIADKCMAPDPHQRYSSVHKLRMALARRSDTKIYLAIIAFLVVMIGVLLWLSSSWAPKAAAFITNL